jgi:hypothetical protein
MGGHRSSSINDSSEALYTDIEAGFNDQEINEAINNGDHSPDAPKNAEGESDKHQKPPRYT